MSPSTFVSAHEDMDALVADVAARVLTMAREAVAKRSVFSLVLSGGASPLPLYRRLAAPDVTQAMPWDRTHLFWGDERFVPANHPDSNYGAAREALLRRIPIPAANVHPVPVSEATPELAAEKYAAVLEGWLAAAPEGAFDLVLLGLGADGHTASLFPGSPALDVSDRLAAPSLAPETARTRRRVTMTYAALARTRWAYCLVSGGEKSLAVRALMAGGGRHLPAARVAPREGLVWHLDLGSLFLEQRAAAPDEGPVLL